MGEVEKVRDRVLVVLGEPSEWTTQWGGGWPNQVESALIDSVLSARARYGGERTGVRGAVAKWKDQRGTEQPNDLSALVAEVERLGGAGPFAEVLGTHQRVPGSRSDRQTKAAAILEAAGLFVAEDLVSAGDVLNETSTEEGAFASRRRFTSVNGLGKVTYTYFHMLLGRPDVKADVMTRRFVAHALGTDDVAPQRARELVVAAAKSLPGGPSPTELDNAIWRWQRVQ